MTLFASPDFGAGAMAAAVLLAFFLAAFLLLGMAFALVVHSCWPARKAAEGRQGHPVAASPAAGFVRILLCGVVVSVLGTCLLPRPLFSLYFGRAPADPATFRVEPGMTEEEVVARNGHPHEKDESVAGESRWNYYTDNWGCGINSIILRFDPEGRVRTVSYHQGARSQVALVESGQ
jgi:hypothetical protein